MPTRWASGPWPQQGWTWRPGCEAAGDSWAGLEAGPSWLLLGICGDGLVPCGWVPGTAFTLGLRAWAPGHQLWPRRRGKELPQAVPVNFFQIKSPFYAELLNQLLAELLWEHPANREGEKR